MLNVSISVIKGYVVTGVTSVPLSVPNITFLANVSTADAYHTNGSYSVTFVPKVAGSLRASISVLSAAGRAPFRRARRP